MSNSPAARLGLIEKLDLFLHERDAKNGSVEDMNWIIEHSKIEGKKAPLSYYKALGAVLEIAQKLQMEEMIDKVMEAVLPLQGPLAEQHCTFEAMQVSKQCFFHSLGKKMNCKSVTPQ